MKTSQKGGLTLWLIIIAVILGEALYIKMLKSEIASLKQAQAPAITQTQ